MFNGLVDLTEPICQHINMEKAVIPLFNTSYLKVYITENNPKYANRIKQLIFLKETSGSGIVKDNSFYNQYFLKAYPDIIVEKESIPQMKPKTLLIPKC